MSKNRDFLKEAIADAKAVKESAIANAKAALEESFTPKLKSMLAQKIEEMDTVKETEDVEEAKKTYEEDDVSEDMSNRSQQVRLVTCHVRCLAHYVTDDVYGLVYVSVGGCAAD